MEATLAVLADQDLVRQLTESRADLAAGRVHHVADLDAAMAQHRKVLASEMRDEVAPAARPPEPAGADPSRLPVDEWPVPLSRCGDPVAHHLGQDARCG